MKHNAELGLGVPGSSGRFWMREYWDRYIRGAKHLKSVIEYIANNPVKAGICSTPDEYQYSGIKTETINQYMEV